MLVFLEQELVQESSEDWYSRQELVCYYLHEASQEYRFVMLLLELESLLFEFVLVLVLLFSHRGNH